MIKQSLIMAYATLVRTEKYIFTEDDRKNKDQKLIPETYQVAVAEYLVVAQ